MLSIAKLRVGQEAYQLTGVAKSLDDYYTGAGEADGWWEGLGAERLGLVGMVRGDDLRAVLAGLAPGSGGLSPNGEVVDPHPRRVPGFDLTFKAPKSLSVLYAVSDDPRVQGAIVEACEVAVRSTLSWLEREAIQVRRGTGNERWLAQLAARDPAAAEEARVRELPARGLAAAVFRHRTSRAGDPLLHWHVLVANLVEGRDGRWSAFVHPQLYRHVRAAGEVFQAAVRVEVSRRLGLVWRPGRHVPEVAGVPQWLCEQFSKRSQEVRAWLAAHGRSNDPESRQAAVLATRRHKPEREGEHFDTLWKAEALAAGWGPDAAEELLTDLDPPDGDGLEGVWRLPERGLGDNGDPGLYDRVVEPEEWIRALLAEDLVAADSTFTRPQLAQAVAARLGDGATVATVERVMARVLSSRQVIPIHDPGGGRWSSAAHLAIERRFLDTVTGSQSTRAPLPAGKVERVLRARATIGDDQADAVRQLTASGDAVTVLVGPAGTGKTFTLDAIRAAYEQAGCRVLGAAPTGGAALELEAGAHVTATTLHRLRARWDHGHDAPDPATVLIVDEAGMAAIADLEPLVTATVAAGGRVLLAGDHRQLPEISAGGGFGALATTKRSTVATLKTNRRQTHDWERTALAQLRDGHIAKAVDTYRTNGRVIVTEHRVDMIATAVDHYFTARSNGHRPVLLAGTNEVVDALNETVRHHLIATGHLPAEPVAVANGRDLAVGDRIVLRRTLYNHRSSNPDRDGIFNAEAATITAPAPDGGIAIRLDHDHATTTLPNGYLADGHVTHAYALTTHRAQGGTWDLAIAVGTDGLYHEAGYTQLSRGKHGNWLVVTQPEIDDLDAELARHDRGIPLPAENTGDDLDEVIGRLHRSRAKLLALARDPHADHVDALAERYPLTHLEQRAAYARAVEQEATRVTRVDPVQVGRELARAQDTARHLEIGHRVHAFDRGNIGTIDAFDDHAGTVKVHFVSPDGEEATKTFGWAEVQLVVPRNPPERHLPPAAQATLDALADATRHQVERWHAHLAAHGVAPLEAQHCERAANLLITRTANQITHNPRPWIDTALGPRPEAPYAAQVWDDAIRTVAAHHTRHHLPTDQPDPAPDATHTRATDWTHTTTELDRSRTWIAAHDPGTRPVTRTRSTTELQARLDQLDALLATAPPDQRQLVHELLAGAQTLHGDTDTQLRDALTQRHARKDWILAHWPHVVEHAEATRTLSTGLAGGPLPSALDDLVSGASPLLVDAAARDERWIRALASQLVGADGSLDAAATALLDEIAAYRARWDVDHSDPLGLAATTDEQARERRRLAADIEDRSRALPQADAAPTLAL